jgi:gamma-glutamyltranspeptidase
MIIFYSLKDHGTSHCSIIDATGNAVAVTSTINTE